MRALSISQPWASLIVAGPKRIENRAINLFTTAIKLTGERIGLHAAKSYDPGIAVEQTRRDLGLPPERKLPRGAMLGTAVIAVAMLRAEVDAAIDAGKVRGDQARWVAGPVCILLADVVPLEAPIPCRGMLGFWTVPGPVLKLLEAGGRS